MRYWIIGVMAIIIVIIGQIVYVSLSLFSHQQEWTDKAIGLAHSQTAISQIDKISQYNGAETYTVVQGTSAENIEMVAWFNDNHLIQMEYTSNLVDEQTIRDGILAKALNTDFKYVKPGIEHDQLIWEVLFVDSEERYNYHYYDMRTGEFIRSYRLQKGTR